MSLPDRVARVVARGARLPVLGERGERDLRRDDLDHLILLLAVGDERCGRALGVAHLHLAAHRLGGELRVVLGVVRDGVVIDGRGVRVALGPRGDGIDGEAERHGVQLVLDHGALVGVADGGPRARGLALERGRRAVAVALLGLDGAARHLDPRSERVLDDHGLDVLDAVVAVVRAGAVGTGLVARHVRHLVAADDRGAEAAQGARAVVVLLARRRGAVAEREVRLAVRLGLVLLVVLVAPPRLAVDRRVVEALAAAHGHARGRALGRLRRLEEPASTSWGNWTTSCR